MVRHRIVDNNIEFTGPTTMAQPPNFYIVSDNVALPFIILLDEHFKLVHSVIGSLTHYYTVSR